MLNKSIYKLVHITVGYPGAGYRSSFLFILDTISSSECLSLVFCHLSIISLVPIVIG